MNDIISVYIYITQEIGNPKIIEIPGQVKTASSLFCQATGGLKMAMAVVQWVTGRVFQGNMFSKAMINHP